MLRIFLQKTTLLLLTALKIAILQIQEKIWVENAYVSQLKEFFPEMKELLEGGREETDTFILPSTNPRCNRWIKQDIIYCAGIFVPRFRILLTTKRPAMPWLTESGSRMVQSWPPPAKGSATSIPIACSRTKQGFSTSAKLGLRQQRL